MEVYFDMFKLSFTCIATVFITLSFPPSIYLATYHSEYYHVIVNAILKVGIIVLPSLKSNNFWLYVFY